MAPQILHRHPFLIIMLFFLERYILPVCYFFSFFTLAHAQKYIKLQRIFRFLRGSNAFFSSAICASFALRIVSALNDEIGKGGFVGTLTMINGTKSITGKLLINDSFVLSFFCSHLFSSLFFGKFCSHTIDFDEG